MRTWDYYVITVDVLTNGSSFLEQQLNCRGKRGWELVQIVQDVHNRTSVIFKRPVPLWWEF